MGKGGGAVSLHIEEVHGAITCTEYLNKAQDKASPHPLSFSVPSPATSGLPPKPPAQASHTCRSLLAFTTDTKGAPALGVISHRALHILRLVLTKP